MSWTSFRTQEIDEQFHYNSITVLAPFVSRWLFYASATTSGVLLIFGFLSFRWRAIRFPAIAFVLAVFAFPCAGINHLVSNLGPWTMCDRVEDEEGNSYVFCDSSFLQGQVMALTRVEQENIWITKVRILGTTNGDSPRSWASVVRPANAQDDYGQLYLTEANKLVGIRFDNRCYLVYDLNERKFLGHGDVEQISPFICIGAADELHYADVRAIERVISKSTQTSGYPRKRSLLSALSHPNPKVRLVAEDFLKRLDSLTAEGTAENTAE